VRKVAFDSNKKNHNEIRKRRKEKIHQDQRIVAQQVVQNHSVLVFQSEPYAPFSFTTTGDYDLSYMQMPRVHWHWTRREWDLFCGARAHSRELEHPPTNLGQLATLLRWHVVLEDENEPFMDHVDFADLVNWRVLQNDGNETLTCEDHSSFHYFGTKTS